MVAAAVAVAVVAAAAAVVVVVVVSVPVAVAAAAVAVVSVTGLLVAMVSWKSSALIHFRVMVPAVERFGSGPKLPLALRAESNGCVAGGQHEAGRGQGRRMFRVGIRM